MKEVKLNGGRTAKVRKAKGKDLLNAQRKINNPDELSYALIAETVELDGSPLLYEDVMEMDLDDVLILQEATSGE